MSTEGAVARVALSGATGELGRILRPALLDHGLQLVSGGRSKPLTPLGASERVVVGDLLEAAVIDRLLGGAEVLVHLAATSDEAPLDVIIENNLRMLQAVYEGAVRNGVRRVVFASSHRAFGMYSVDERIDAAAAYRPDGLYGLSKAWGEALARMYWDKRGIESVVVRIGSVLERPSEARHLSTWLGYRDFARLMIRCIDAPINGFASAWGVSANSRSYWDSAGAEAIGFKPDQSADDYANEILLQENPLPSAARLFHGGRAAVADYTAPEPGPQPRD